LDPSKDEDNQYEDIEEAAKLVADLIFSKPDVKDPAKEWMKDTYVDGDDLIHRGS
jgi:hypothetical protein